MIRDDSRRIAAKQIPIMDVATRLGFESWFPQGFENLGPCPRCGGNEDRLSIHPGKNLFLCRLEEDSGDQLDLVQHILGCSFREALDYLVDPAAPPPDPAEAARLKAKAQARDARQREIAAQKRAQAVRNAREIWHSAQPGAGTAAEAYLERRGLQFAAWPPTLRFLPDYPYLAAKPGQKVLQEIHRGPCMIAGVQNGQGQVRAVHRTWIDLEQPKGKARIIGFDDKALNAKTVLGSMRRGAIRLSPQSADGRMVIGEGIETTTSALVAGIWPGAAFWCGVSLTHMGGKRIKQPGILHSDVPRLEDPRAFIPPPWVNRLLLIQDMDSDEAATGAKLRACIARAQDARPDLQGEILQAAPGQDLNDMLLDMGV
jgi:hypothetical protein